MKLKKNRPTTPKLFKEFFESEKSGGLVLIACTAISLVLANSVFGSAYLHFWHTNFAGQSIEYWINDGLMTIFFLLIGLELEREVYQGELSDIKNALLPIFGAIGGMLVPAALYLFFNYGTFTQSGAGIPMATDIAFALGILSLLGKKVPTSLKVFLTALAVIDDLGAILVIAIFYTKTLLWTNLFVALGIFGFLLILNRLKIKKLNSLLNWGCNNVVFYAEFGCSRYHYRSFIGFCHSFWRRKQKINFHCFTTFFAQTCRLRYTTHICIGEHGNNFEFKYGRSFGPTLQPWNCIRAYRGKTSWNIYNQFIGSKTRNLQTPKRSQLEIYTCGGIFGWNWFYNVYFCDLIGF
jgi:hypothetical protein